MNINNKLTLKRNFSWVFLGNIIFAFGQWAILSIMTKLVMVEEVGNFSYAIAITAPIVLFFEMQMRSVQVTDTKDEYNFNDYFGFRLTSSLISFGFANIISLLLGNGLKMTMLIASVALMKLSDSVSDIFYGLFQKHEYMKYIAISRIIKSVITIISFGIALYVTKNIVISILLITLLKIIVILIYDFRKAKIYTDVTPKFSYTIFKKLLIVSFPLGMMSLLMSLDSNVSRYVMKHYEGPESLGYFSALSYINMAGGQMITSVAQAVTPRLAIFYSAGNKKAFKNLLIKLTLFGFIIGIFSVLFVVFLGEDLITILYSKEYAKHLDVFIIIMIAGAIDYTGSFLGNGMTAARAFKIQPFLGGIWVIASLAISLMMIPRFGLLGGAVALVISSIVKIITKTLVIWKLLKLSKGVHFE